MKLGTSRSLDEGLKRRACAVRCVVRGDWDEWRAAASRAPKQASKTFGPCVRGGASRGEPDYGMKRER